MDKGDQVWWINGAGDKLTGTVLEPTRGIFRALVWCHERNRELRPRVLHLREERDHFGSPKTGD